MRRKWPHPLPNPNLQRPPLSLSLLHRLPRSLRQRN
jgi:hypothetical protein